jgi:hypothetical protein
MIRITIVIAAGLALATTLPTVPAHAAARDRVFVASYGIDSGTCTFGSPCRTFQYAVSAVAVGGEVTAIDSAGFGPVTITQSVTITSPAGVEAGIAAAAGADAIDINAPGATVKLRGLTLDGANSGNYGINFGAGSRIEILDCVISDFERAGISIGQTGTISVLISNTIVLDTNAPANASAGIVLGLGVNGGSITAALDHVTISNDNSGLIAQAYSGSVETLVTDSHIDNTSVGVYIFGNTNSTSSMILKNVTLNQDPTGISLNGTSSVWMSQVTQTSVPGFVNTAVTITSGSTIAYSDGTNHLMGAVTGGSTTSWASN